MHSLRVHSIALRLCQAVCLLWVLQLGAAHADATDIANVPLISGNTVVIKPNIMLLLDTSNSMSWTHMPDSMEVAGTRQSMGYKNSACNTLYYDPTRTYVVPRDAANAALPTPSFTAAPYDYYSDPNRVVDLSAAFQAHDAKTVENSTSLPDTPQQAYYYAFYPDTLTPGHIVYSGMSLDQWKAYLCTLADTIAPNTNDSYYNILRRVIVSDTSGIAGRPDERTNFAIWYTYYRTRLSLAKSAIGRAFAPLSNNFRVGLLTVNPTMGMSNGAMTVNDSVQTEHYTPIADFDSAQRTLWYSKFYGQLPGGSSPAREGLARVGRHYAGKTDGINAGMSQDPVQYACQPNFAIMTTDGYWNVAAEKAAPGGGPTTIAGDAWVGQQDSPLTPDGGLVPAGIYDGTTAQLGYRVDQKVSTQISYPSCTLSLIGRQIVSVIKYVKPPVTKTTVARDIPGVLKLVTSHYEKVSQYKIKTVVTYQKLSPPTQQTVSYSWYDAVHEQTVSVTSCTGRSNCTMNTATVPDPNGSCVPSAQWVNGVYQVVNCYGSTNQNTTAFCTNGVNGCVVTTTTTNVANSQCSAATTTSPTYTVTSCQPVSAPMAITNACSSDNNSYPSIACTKVQDATVDVASCPATGVLNSTQFTECALYGGVCPVADCSPTITYTPGVCINSNTYSAPFWTLKQCSLNADATTWTVTRADPATVTATTTDANGYQTSYVTYSSSATTVPSCDPHSASQDNAWVATNCVPVSGVGAIKSSTRTTYATWVYDNGVQVVQPVVVGPTVAVPGETCQPLPSPAVPAPDVVLSSFSVTASNTGGSSNSLADVAQYYYRTDLRPDMPNIVRAAGNGWADDTATWQHMTTFVVGLGVSGTLPYQADYATANTGTFAAIRAGTSSWPVWPDPNFNYVGNDIAYNSPKSIDDFWHAAVDGRGKYFSANNPDAVVAGIQGALTAISATAQAGTGMTISDQVGKTINGVNYTSDYTTVNWVGDVQAWPSASGSSMFWSAKSKLQQQVNSNCDDRTIYVRSSTGSTHLAEFTANTKRCSDGSVSSALSAGLLAVISATELSQYAAMTSGTVDQRAQATADSLVNYVRGQTQNEGYVSGVSGKLYRTRVSALGDFIGSKPQYVGAPFYQYLDTGYASYRAAQAARSPMIYVGGNDGMLHAFYAPDTTATGTTLANAGKEAWAYIPTALVAHLSKLADVNYATNHRYFVDGTPTIADVQFADGIWHTILVGGLNAGGKAYYALDITDPGAPVSLWELDSSNCSPNGCGIGLTYGQPVVGKLANGTWAAFLTSGYNNSGGQASLFVLNAQTGQAIKTITAGSANAGTPSGLSQISAWTNYPALDNTVQRVYGGDLRGNIWRFDVNDESTTSAYLLGVALDSRGARQPITTAPELAMVKGHAYVYVGTGRLLGISDLSNTQQQSIYGILDDLGTTTDTTALRDKLNHFVTQTDFTIACDVHSTCEPGNTKGFVVDLAGSQEQIILPLSLVGSTLVAVTNQPQSGVCGSGGTSNVYFVDAVSGRDVSAGMTFGNSAVGLTYVNGSDGSAYLYARSSGSHGGSAGDWGTDSNQTSDTVHTSDSPPVQIPTGNGAIPGSSRSSWREIKQQ